MIYKKVTTIVFMTLYLSSIWFLFSSGYTHLAVPKAIFWMNNTVDGYSSLRAYTLYYPIPFFIFLNLFFLGERNYIIIRWGKRANFYKKITTDTFIAALLFSALHLLVNVILTYSFLNGHELNQSHFLVIALENMLGLVFYFFWIGMLYRLLQDLNDSMGQSMLLTALLIGGFYFVSKLYIPPEKMWQPSNDLVIFQFLIEKKWTLTDVLFVYMRQFFMGAILYLVGSTVFLRKDFKS